MSFKLQKDFLFFRDPETGRLRQLGMLGVDTEESVEEIKDKVADKLTDIISEELITDKSRATEKTQVAYTLGTGEWDLPTMEDIDTSGIEAKLDELNANLDEIALALQ